jgi:hypothetical protein
MTGRAIELYGETLLICTASGCRPARFIDLAEVAELLPEFLQRQDRQRQAHEWRQLARRQMRLGASGGAK